MRKRFKVTFEKTHSGNYRMDIYDNKTQQYMAVVIDDLDKAKEIAKLKVKEIKTKENETMLRDGFELD